MSRIANGEWDVVPYDNGIFHFDHRRGVHEIIGRTCDPDHPDYFPHISMTADVTGIAVAWRRGLPPEFHRELIIRHWPEGCTERDLQQVTEEDVQNTRRLASELIATCHEMKRNGEIGDWDDLIEAISRICDHRNLTPTARIESPGH
jgi:hypothetical protein